MQPRTVRIIPFWYLTTEMIIIISTVQLSERNNDLVLTRFGKMLHNIRAENDQKLGKAIFYIWRPFSLADLLKLTFFLNHTYMNVSLSKRQLVSKRQNELGTSLKYCVLCSIFSSVLWVCHFTEARPKKKCYFLKIYVKKRMPV